MTDKIESERFFTRKKTKVLFATPLLLVLILVEPSDVTFAVDSIPANLRGHHRSVYIVLDSNLFAILGLRAMYLLLAGVAERFSMLKYGLVGDSGVYWREDADRRLLPYPGFRHLAGRGGQNPRRHAADQRLGQQAARQAAQTAVE
ncbi:hypothetical protein MJK72_25150 [Klebsiella pneumoniae]|nr:hypothetical protein MJK72_25150 [Klebsiella pneumoniae]